MYLISGVNDHITGAQTYPGGIIVDTFPVLSSSRCLLSDPRLHVLWREWRSIRGLRRDPSRFPQ